MYNGSNTGYYSHAGGRDDRALSVGKSYMEGAICFWKIREKRRKACIPAVNYKFSEKKAVKCYIKTVYKRQQVLDRRRKRHTAEAGFCIRRKIPLFLYGVGAV